MIPLIYHRRLAIRPPALGVKAPILDYVFAPALTPMAPPNDFVQEFMQIYEKSPPPAALAAFALNVKDKNNTGMPINPQNPNQYYSN